jgi:hypothetical protein
MPSLVHVSHGIWRPAEDVAALAGRVAALLHACPDGTVVAGATAAQLHGLWLPGRDSDGDAPVEVIVHPDIPVPRMRSHNRRAEVRARRQMLRPDEVGTVEGIPVTTEARTWLDLSDRLPLADLVAAGDSALRGNATVDEMAELVTRARRRRGVVRARTALPLLDARSRSRPESHMRYAIVSRGLPKPEVNVPIHSRDGEWLFEPDLSYDDVRLALEYNGADHAGLTRMRRDITRELEVEMRDGWRTIVFGPREVFGRPDQIAVHVRALRRERRHLFR